MEIYCTCVSYFALFGGRPLRLCAAWGGCCSSEDFRLLLLATGAGAGSSLRKDFMSSADLQPIIMYRWYRHKVRISEHGKDVTMLRNYLVSLCKGWATFLCFPQSYLLYDSWPLRFSLPTVSKSILGFICCMTRRWWWFRCLSFLHLLFFLKACRTLGQRRCSHNLSTNKNSFQ